MDDLFKLDSLVQIAYSNLKFLDVIYNKAAYS